MSQAFVRESEEQWLHDVSPTLQALIVYLTRENNGIRVYEQKTIVDKHFGTISLASTLGKGSTFTITLPKRNMNMEDFHP